MNILSVHNRYLQPGGEDAVFEEESALLEERGHQVSRLVFDNDEIGDQRSLITNAHLAVTTIWSGRASRRVVTAIEASQAEVVHFHNTFPLVSPAAYSVCQAFGVPVVQTLHNYRLLCPNSYLFRDGKPCEDCVGRTPPFPGVVHACYHDSRVESAVVAAMLTTHRVRRTWHRDVDRFIALTAFCQAKFISGGLPAEKIVVKPNFAAGRPARSGDGEYMLFVGRLSPEKGVATMLRSWQMTGTMPPIRIVGDGPEREEVERVASAIGTITTLGRLSRSEVWEQMSGARALVFPSEWYETFGLSVVEAFACGVPAVASRLGVMTEIVDDGRTGLLFNPGDADDLAAKVHWAWNHPAEMRRMGEAARREYELKYTPARNYDLLMAIYEEAIEENRRRRAT